MAGPLPCDNHPDQLAVILTTNLEAGETLTLCWPCTLEWAAMLIGVSQESNNLEQISPPAAEPMPANVRTAIQEGGLPVDMPTEEVADLEPVAPAPDAEPKTEPEPAPTPAPKAKRRAQAAQETEAPGE